jgi:CRP-like cAMP-binding protein
LRLDKESFEQILKEYPEIYKKNLEEANFRMKVTTYKKEILENLQENLKTVTRKFIVHSQEKVYESHKQ